MTHCVDIPRESVVVELSRFPTSTSTRKQSLLRGMLVGGEHRGPFTPASVTVDLNVASVAGGSSSGGMRKHQHEMPGDMLTGARNLFDGMPATVDDDTTNRFFENMIFEGGAPAAGVYDPDENQSQDG
ncbi:DNA repair protein rhp54 [Hordeum vulgare]|nr:DNA repair protein rhp54 [Hordeum vulgare]